MHRTHFVSLSSLPGPTSALSQPEGEGICGICSAQSTAGHPAMGWLQTYNSSPSALWNHIACILRCGFTW